MLCGSDRLTYLTGSVRFGYQADVYQCRNCTLTFLDQSSFEFLDGFYKTQYHQTYLTHVEPDASEPDRYYEKMIKTTAPWAEKFKSMLKGDETILDMGCSTGHFLELIHPHARAVYGYEVNQKEGAFCREKLGLDVSDIPLAERFDAGMFDYITLIFVLEHIADPVLFLRDLSMFLKPQGKLVILVPNILDPLMSFFDLPDFQHFYYCIEHLYYFTPETLKRVFEKANLTGTLETIQEYPLSNHLNWGYGKTPKDTVLSRIGVPDIPVSRDQGRWACLWQELDTTYKKFLAEQNLGDRLWAVAGRTVDIGDMGEDK